MAALASSRSIRCDRAERRRVAIGGASSVSTFCRARSSADRSSHVTPEDDHGYPAALKGSTIGVATSGTRSRWRSYRLAASPRGIRAVEQLRQVFAELHVVSIRDAGELFEKCMNLADFDANRLPGIRP